MLTGLVAHLLLTLRLNFRSALPIVYGYLVPILFLVGFAAIFHSLIEELGQILTITILGGACFGMPTALVAERERGIWRRYRLSPMGAGSLVFSTMVARVVLVASSVLLQIVLAMAVYGMPQPNHPGGLVIAFLFVAWAFLGMGLVIAMLADTVPAVQALGQAIFLPMLLIGGVGVPLDALPRWAQIVAAFLPGRYAVEAMSACAAGGGIGETGFDLAALGVIGLAACVTGMVAFRWDGGQRLSGRQKMLAAIPLLAWAGVGIAAAATGQIAPSVPAQAYQSITEAQVNSITYDNLQDDNSFVTPLISSLDDVSPAARQWTLEFSAKLAAWPPGNEADPVQMTRNLLAVAAIADLDQFKYEAEVPYDVFVRLKEEIPKDRLIKILAYVILDPNGGMVPASADELGIQGRPPESDVRDRISQYAKKLLGRLLRKLS